MVSVAGPTRPSCVRVRRGAPNERRGSSVGLEHLISRRSLPGMLHPWARAGSRRFPGDPSYAFALLQDPGRADKTSPVAVLPAPPPAYPNRRPQRVYNLEANTGLQHPLSTLHERRRRLPCKNSLPAGGLRLYREGVEPSGSLRKVSGYITVLLSRTCPVARIVCNNLESSCVRSGCGHAWTPRRDFAVSKSVTQSLTVGSVAFQKAGRRPSHTPRRPSERVTGRLGGPARVASGREHQQLFCDESAEERSNLTQWNSAAGTRAARLYPNPHCATPGCRRPIKSHSSANVAAGDVGPSQPVNSHRHQPPAFLPFSMAKSRPAVQVGSKMD